MTDKKPFLLKNYTKANFCGFLVHTDMTRSNDKKLSFDRLQSLIDFGKVIEKIYASMDINEKTYFSLLNDAIINAHLFSVTGIFPPKVTEKDINDFFREIELEGDSLLYTEDFKEYNTLVYGHCA